MIQSISADR